jgi:glutamate-1-semialdehyde 2,1-aminomutase
VREKLNVCSLALTSEGPSIVDLDGNKALDVSGSYGVNVCGYDAYKARRCKLKPVFEMKPPGFGA